MMVKGYVRPDGRAGIRNHVLILPSVLCSSETCEQIAAQVKGAVTLANQAGCAQVGDDVQQTKRTLAGFGMNPNVAAVLVVGLGCESVDPYGLAQEIEKSGKPVETLVIQEAGGTVKTIEQGVQLAKKLKAIADTQPRQDIAWNQLSIGIQYGDETTSTQRAAMPAVEWASARLAEQGAIVLRTKEMETLTIDGQLRYGEQPREQGQYLMAGGTSDAEGITGMIAGGASLILYATGEGNPVGSPISPVIKVCGDPELMSIMGEELDIDASGILEKTHTIPEIGQMILSDIGNVTNGKATKNEELGFSEFAIHRVLPSF
ncbi:altronate dehydratase [Caldalkalibacillus uzonensis]|uniref:Altronate dehydratase n=1 Tax=Caldalkalibacillus uzonensis TaxID=353224 RepID=A0ABU0CQX5_9BACI|nr:UxaA family hydrolase [Caldalkalibacillus uzonensis]MDQ0338296.1 altronate dehydratase [Caldalkalibacillus uzonensis]